jgi:hypothetical protein
MSADFHLNRLEREPQSSLNGKRIVRVIQDPERSIVDLGIAGKEIRVVEQVEQIYLYL